MICSCGKVGVAHTNDRRQIAAVFVNAILLDRICNGNQSHLPYVHDNVLGWFNMGQRMASFGTMFRRPV